MLLPSALPCERSSSSNFASNSTPQPSRPLLRRFMQYSSTTTSSVKIPTISTISETAPLPPIIHDEPINPYLSPDSPSSISSGIQSTCRALQSLLGVTPPPARLNQTPRPRIPVSERTSPFAALPIDNRAQKKRRSPLKSAPPVQSYNKRTRSTFEADLDSDLDIEGKENQPYDYYYTHNSTHGSATKLVSTPKRRRRLAGPTHLPFGLERSDFADLEPESAWCTPPSYNTTNYTTTFSPQNDESSNEMHIDLPSTPGAATSHASPSSSFSDEEGSEPFWTPLDDAQLVTVVLEKLKLSRSDWEECARCLGAEGEGGSLGRRFRWLLEEGKVGFTGSGEGRSGSRRIGRQSGARRDVRGFF